MLTAADQWIEVRTSDVGASLEGKKSQRFIFSRLVTPRSLIFSQLASAALKWILISALMQTCQINFADLGYDWPKIASASVVCSKPMNFNHGQNGLVAFFVRNLNRKGLNCKCQGMMLFCSFQKLVWWRSKKLLCRVYSWQMLRELCCCLSTGCALGAPGLWEHTGVESTQEGSSGEHHHWMLTQLAALAGLPPTSVSVFLFVCLCVCVCLIQDSFTSWGESGLAATPL